MDIVYLGHSSFKLKGKNTSVITDPFDPQMLGLKFPKNEADIVTVSHNHSDHNHLELVSGVKMVINSPGEYEVMDVSVIGIEVDHDSEGGKVRGKNTVFVFEIDGIRLAHLGDLGHKLTDKVTETISDVDVLMLPVGGFFTIGAKEASEIAKGFESPFIIPMHYRVPGMKEEIASKIAPVDDFLKEFGIEVDKTDKLNIKKELINYEQQKVILLEKR